MPASRLFLVCFCAPILCAALPAQDANTIHIHLRDGRTGVPINADNYLVRVDGNETLHSEWVHIGDDNSVVITLPADAQRVAVEATYGMSMNTYIDCAIAKESNKDRHVWYPIAKILESGMVAPNECSTTHYTAKPGELVFFVRKRSWHDPAD